MTIKGILTGSVAVAALIASAMAVAGMQLISAENYGKEWPFTVEEMHLMCLPGNAVVVSDPESGVMYPLNGIASSKARQLALEPLAEVWRDNPENPGAKVSVSRFIDEGLKLCK
ncbi:DUF2511 domain-containing protein [Pseudomonas sp. NPDC078700]|uniref:DUF2511 domain-containing protein n=1 Tax=Pseudomonas sp. NPDC078700 TaxID=3364424 RepID=UPI0037CB2569